MRKHVTDKIPLYALLLIPMLAGPALSDAPRPGPAPVGEVHKANQVYLAHQWSARAGDDLVDVLTRWGERAGYKVIIEAPSDWRFAVAFEHEGGFRQAVDMLLDGFSTAAVPPVVTFYTNNVMTIGVR